MIKLIVAGSKGRMGQEIIKMAQGDPQRFGRVLGFDKEDDPSMIEQGDVVVDFSVPAATTAHVQVAKKARKAMVIGTTGLDNAQQQAVEEAAKVIPIVQSSNMSRGMNVVFKEAQNIAKHLRPTKIQITEKHHVHKKDAPSGSALTLKSYILHPSSGWTGDVPIKSIREGEIVGEHSALEEGWEEEVEIIHRAKSRAPFAAGALDAAAWVVTQKPGLYTMQDVLHLGNDFKPR